MPNRNRIEERPAGGAAASTHVQMPLHRMTLTRGRETRFSSVKRLLLRAKRGYVFSKPALITGITGGAGDRTPQEYLTQASQFGEAIAASGFNPYD